MKKKQRNRALKKRRHISEDELSPGIAAGLTQGVPLKEALEMHPVSTAPSGVELVRHMRDVEQAQHRRVPLPKFVASEDADSVWYDEPTGRIQKNVTATFQPEVVAAIKAGEICLRCLEPQDEPFPDICTSPPEMGCSYPIRDRQIMDVAMEFEGDRHLGPARPITEFLEEQDLRREKRKFIERKIEGGGGKIPKEWLRDATLFPDGVPKELL